MDSRMTQTLVMATLTAAYMPLTTKLQHNDETCPSTKSYPAQLPCPESQMDIGFQGKVMCLAVVESQLTLHLRH